MATRQDILIAALNEADRKQCVDVDQLLCSFSEAVRDDESLPFYHFNIISGKPASLQLQKDISFLEKNGFLVHKDRAVKLTQKGKKRIPNDTDLYFRIANIVQDCNKCAKKVNLKPYSAKINVYTIGYEGYDVDTFFRKLIAVGIKNIIDVRKNPISRKFGFSKKYLLSFSDLFGLKYIHHPELGIPSEDRKELGSEDSYKKLFDTYESTILKNTQKAQMKVAEEIKSSPSVLLCYEANARYCHRSRLANNLAKITELCVFDI